MAVTGQRDARGHHRTGLQQAQRAHTHRSGIERLVEARRDDRRERSSLRAGRGFDQEQARPARDVLTVGDAIAIAVGIERIVFFFGEVAMVLTPSAGTRWSGRAARSAVGVRLQVGGRRHVGPEHFGLQVDDVVAADAAALLPALDVRRF